MTLSAATAALIALGLSLVGAPAAYADADAVGDAAALAAASTNPVLTDFEDIGSLIGTSAVELNDIVNGGLGSNPDIVLGIGLAETAVDFLCGFLCSLD